MTNHKDIAVKFLNLVVQNKIDEAYNSYIDMSGKHHNLFYPPDFVSLKNGMEENGVQFPSKQIAIKTIVAEGDLVAIYSHLTLKPNEAGMAVVHIFRFENGKIIEMWDCGQPIPENSPNPL